MLLLVRILIFVAIVLLLLGAPAMLLRWAYPRLWHRWLAKTILVAYSITVVAITTWAITRHTSWAILGRAGLILASTVFLAGLGLLVSAPLWVPMLTIIRRSSNESSADGPTNPQRRAALLKLAGAIPASTVMLSPIGAAASLAPPILRRVDIPIRHLPPALAGLKILQLTDIHLGTYIDLDHVQRAIDVAREESPHLVVLTGDIADDYKMLPAALEITASLQAPLGTFACIGNHEIYRGRKEAEAIYRKSSATYLCEEGRILEHNGERLWLCGADDPARLFRRRTEFLETTVRRSIAACPPDIALRILLCHRPTGFNAAAQQGVSLTLAGHTHGGQMALAGRSLFEKLLPDYYLMGHYQRDDMHLFTSAGLGHWLPFRLNCPCEAALITLTQAPPPQ